ncbi:hypothetical protein J27TS7_05480 [Paenibacillus dendritiformis]|uniref:hypothetical protein n=1 Tax=Paenibacillus dendritiformis TaxID=130049 RepID=UPI001B13020C|nr:hypothetical protein [Paenibacillus dendritiformis]GIO71034.1 hypothetical protein J27TS7_05480 [Paenibacillus dendritiformis]
MKTINSSYFIGLALFFAAIFFPAILLQDWRIAERAGAMELTRMYDGAVHAAVQDAAFALHRNEYQKYEAGYDSIKYFRANKERALEQFYETLFTNFDVSADPVGQQALLGHIPVIAVVDYDGYWIHAYGEIRTSAGELESKPLWHAKKPYAYADESGNSVSFTLDDYVHAFDAATARWHEGKRERVNEAAGQRIPLLADADQFEQVRRATIVHALQTDLAYYINLHNTQARKLGVTYMFTLPLIGQEEWNNTVDDIGFITFIQGLPMGKHHYNNYAFGGGRLVKRPVVYGAIRDGIRVYYRSRCGKRDAIEETFASEKEAAAQGYFPRPCPNGTP